MVEKHTTYAVPLETGPHHILRSTATTQIAQLAVQTAGLPASDLTRMQPGRRRYVRVDVSSQASGPRVVPRVNRQGSRDTGARSRGPTGIAT